MKTLMTILMILIVGSIAMPAAADDYKMTGTFNNGKASFSGTVVYEFPYDIDFAQVNVTGDPVEFSLATANADSANGAQKYPDGLGTGASVVHVAIEGIPFDNARLGNVRYIRMSSQGTSYVNIPYSEVD